MVLEKTLESPLDCKRYNQSILKEISPGCSLEELRLKLKLQYFGHLMGRTDSLEKTVMMGNIEGRRRRRPGLGSWSSQLSAGWGGSAPVLPRALMFLGLF